MRRRIVFWASIIVGSCVLVSGLLIYLSRLSSFEVAEIVVEGNVVTHEEEIREVVEEEIESYVWGLFPRSNILLIPKKEIAGTLLETFPRLYVAEVVKESNKTLRVRIEERRPVALWCGESVEIEECQFIDQGGTLYAAAPHFSGDVFTRIYTSLESISEESLKEVLELSHFLNEHNAEIAYFYLSTPGEGYFVLNSFKEGVTQETRIYVPLHNEAERVVRNIKTFFEVQEGEATKKPQFIQYEYIDARFGEQIYFRERSSTL